MSIPLFKLSDKSNRINSRPAKMLLILDLPDSSSHLLLHAPVLSEAHESNAEPVNSAPELFACCCGYGCISAPRNAFHVVV